MKFLSRFNFALCVIAFIGVMALAVVNIARGIIGIKGILIAALFVILYCFLSFIRTQALCK